MKSNLFTVTAIVISVLISSFTTKRGVTVYCVFEGGFQERDPWNWTFTTFDQFPQYGDEQINWFSFQDDDGYVDNIEFYDAFDDRDMNFNRQLSDEQQIPGVLDKKDPW